MSKISISEPAVEKILDDPEFQESRENGNTSLVPILRYFQRSYSTLNDGRVIEHGDGFMLVFAHSAEIIETDDISYKTIPVAKGIDVLVVGPTTILSRSFSIGWSNAKFTLESQSPL